MLNRIISAALLSSIIAGALVPVANSMPRKDSRDRYRDIAPRGTVVPRNQRAPKMLKMRSPRKARNAATIASVKGFNFSYFEVPTFKENGPLVREVFDKYQAEGFNLVRLPIRWDDDASATAPYTINPALTWGKINWVIAEARKRGFKVIINIHAYDALMKDPAGQEARFLAIWNQIATAYRSEAADLWFEVLNEPNGEFNVNPGLWNALQTKAIAEIRKTNPSRLIVATPVRWSNSNSLDKLTLPADANLVVGFHEYENDFSFTHSGAEWVSPMPSCGATWAGTTAQRNAINQKMDKAVTWSNQRQVPLFMGEFGTYGRCTKVGDRARWTSHVRKAAEARGIGWTYWEAHKGFGAYNPGTNQWIPELLNALRYW